MEPEPRPQIGAVSSFYVPWRQSEHSVGRSGPGPAVAAADHRTAACCSYPWAYPCHLPESAVDVAGSFACPADSAFSAGVGRTARCQRRHRFAVVAVAYPVACEPGPALVRAPDFVSGSAAGAFA